MSFHEGQSKLFPYVYKWGPRMPGALARKGQRCRMLVRGSMNSALIEFEDGETAVISRNAIRKAKPEEKGLEKETGRVSFSRPTDQ